MHIYIHSHLYRRVCTCILVSQAPVCFACASVTWPKSGWLFLTVFRDNKAARSFFCVFAMIHVGLHYLLRHHPKYEFNNAVSWSIIVLSGAAGFAHLLVERSSSRQSYGKRPWANMHWARTLKTPPSLNLLKTSRASMPQCKSCVPFGLYVKPHLKPLCLHTLSAGGLRLKELSDTQYDWPVGMWVVVKLWSFLSPQYNTI